MWVRVCGGISGAILTPLVGEAQSPCWSGWVCDGCVQQRGGGVWGLDRQHSL